MAFREMLSDGRQCSFFISDFKKYKWKVVVVLPFKNDFQVFNPPPRSLECKNPNKSAISCHALERCTETSCGDPLQWEKDGG